MSDFKSTIEHKYRHIARMPDAVMGFTIPIRRLAIGHLNLSPGSSVIDVGCGSGASFPYLIEAVGRQGVIVGIDISPSMVSQARKRIKNNQWSNITVNETATEEYQDRKQFDGALLFAMHDVFTSKQAMAKVESLLKPGARIVCVGPKLLEGFPKSLMNIGISQLFKRFAISQRDRDRPWRTAEFYFQTLELIELMHGALFVFVGQKNIGLDPSEQPPYGLHQTQISE